MEPGPLVRLISFYEWCERMLVEPGTRVIDREVVGDAHAIALDYLRRSGGIADDFVANDRLLSMIVQVFRGVEVNELQLANKAIAKFEEELV